MTSPPLRQTLNMPILALGVVLLLMASVGLQVARDRWYAEERSRAAVLYVDSPSMVRRLALSYTALVADLYWIRAIQHYGTTKRSTRAGKSYALLYPLLDIVTTLDPEFNIAYRFGAIFLAEAYPGGPGRPDLAVALLQKGVRANPRRWEYLQDIGFVYYWWYQDYRTAAAWFEKASQIDGAPWWLHNLAATTLTEGGERQASRMMWTQIRDSSEQEWIRTEANRRLAQLTALDDIDALRVLVARFESGTGRQARSWTQLVAAGYLPAAPLDPTGTPYVLMAGQRRVDVSPTSLLFPLPVAARVNSPAGAPS